MLARVACDDSGRANYHCETCEGLNCFAKPGRKFIRNKTAGRIWVCQTADDWWAVYDEGLRLGLWKNELWACKRTGTCPYSVVNAHVALLFQIVMLYVNTNTLPYGNGYLNESPVFCAAHRIVSAVLTEDRDRKMKKVTSRGARNSQA